MNYLFKSVSVLVLLMIISFGVGKDIAHAKQKLVTFGTGSTVGLYYPTGVALGELVNEGRHEHGYRFAVETTSGSRYNLKSVQAGEQDFGFVQSDVHYNAYMGKGRFEKQGKAKTLRSVMSVAMEPLHIITRADAEILDLEGLKGKKVNAGARGSGHLEMFHLFLKAMDWEEKDFAEVRKRKNTGQAENLCAGKIDALFVTVPNNSKFVTDLSNQCDIAFVAISGPDIDTFVAKQGFLGKTTIRGGQDEGGNADTATIGPVTTLVVNERVSTDIVYQLVKAVFDNFEGLRNAHPAFADLKKEEMVHVGLTAPLHTGAKKYYKEAGLL